MSSDSPQAPFAPSGMPSVDATWGGFRRGGTYLLVGPLRGARALAAIEAVRATTQHDQRALLVSARPPEALAADADAVGYDLGAASREGRAKLLRVPTASELRALGDEGLAATLGDLAGLAQAHTPARIVLDDFTALIQFQSFEAFSEAFERLMDEVGALGTTLVLGMGAPANETSRQLLGILERQTDGSIHLSPDSDTLPTLVAGRPAPIPSSPPPTGAEAFSDSPSEEHNESSSEEPHAEEPHAEEPPSVDAAPAPQASTSPISPDPESAHSEYSSADGYGDGTGPAVDPPDLIVARPSAPPNPQPPPPAASSEEPPPAEIRPVDPSEAPFDAVPPARASFGRDLLALGHFVDSDDTTDRVPRAAARPQATGRPPVAPSQSDSGTSVHEVANAVHVAAYPELFAPLGSPKNAEDQFRSDLADAFAQRGTVPFVVLALRFAAGSPHRDLLPAVTSAIRSTLGVTGRLYEHDGLLVALLPGAKPNAAQAVFATLRTHLHEANPERAEEALQHISALVATDGEPFDSGDALLNYAIQN